MNRHIKALLIALVVIGVFACNVDRDVGGMIGDAMVDTGTVIRDASTDAAAAQEVPCAQWEVSIWNPGSDGRCDQPASCMVPAGWEPMHRVDGRISYVIRRCAD